MKFLVIIIPSFLITLILLRVILDFSLKYKFGRRNDGGRVNIKGKQPPRLGGVGIFVGFLAGNLMISSMSFSDIMKDDVGYGMTQFTVYLLSLFTIFLLGLIDDLKGLNAWQKLPVEIIAASILFFLGFRIDILTVPFSPGVVELAVISSYALTIIWIVGITNAMNLLDGLDGLAGGVALISTVSFVILSYLNNRLDSVFLAVAIIGPLVAFLKYNFYPSRLIMGDSGSLFLGFFLATLSINASTKASFGITFIVPIIILFLPILDTLTSFFRRILQKKHPFKADNGHIHHKLLEKVNSEKRVFFIVMSWSVLFAVLGVISALMSKKIRTLLIGIVLLVGIAIMMYLKYIDVRSLIKRDHPKE